MNCKLVWIKVFVKYIHVNVNHCRTTHSETVRVLLSLEYGASGKGSQTFRFENQKVV